jgi:hypothetical protein
VGLVAHNSRVGSFEQQNGHQTYNMTDDLRAVRSKASYWANVRPFLTDDLGAKLILPVVVRPNRLTDSLLVDNYR